MCGIGFIASPSYLKWETTKPMIIKMLLALEERGKDASGITLIDPYTDTITYLKHGSTASDFIQLKAFENLGANINFSCVLIHTRAATTGNKKDNLNNHPIYIKENHSILVHNGIIQNHKEVFTKFKLKRDGEVDSEIIGKLYAKKNNMKQTLKELCGSMAFLLYHDTILHVYKNTMPFIIAYNVNTKMLYGASTQEAIDSINNDILVLNYFTKPNPQILQDDLPTETHLTIDLKTLQNIGYESLKTKEIDYGTEDINWFTRKNCISHLDHEVSDHEFYGISPRTWDDFEGN